MWFISLLVVPLFLGSLEYFFNVRSYELERQDKNEADGNYNKTEYLDLMHILAETNMVDPNGHQATLKYGFDELTFEPNNILEIGFGLGHFSTLLAQKYPKCSVLGIDVHQLSVDSANHYVNNLPNNTPKPNNVNFEIREQPQLNEPENSFDIITTTFVNHHIFPDEEFVDFLKKVAKVGRKSFIFNDFYRSLKCIGQNDIQFLFLRYIGIEKGFNMVRQFLPDSLINQIRVFQNVLKERPGLDLVIDGGMLSMRRSFSLKEYDKMFKAAGYPSNALKCTCLNKWYDFGSTCRVVCVADLTWSQ